MEYKEKIQKIVNYIKSGEKNPEDFAVGFESEHFVVDENSLNTISYYGENGIAESMEEISKLGYDKHVEDGNILGLSKDRFDISVEPASQFELALASRKNINDLYEDYKVAMGEIVPVFERKGQVLAMTGYHPRTKIDDIKIIPKKRYDYMYEYFRVNGAAYAHNMMKGTASLQTAIDYSSEEDFKKKYLVASAMGPFLYSMFDNAYIFEGEVYNKRNLRQMIWDNCDRTRTGTYEFAFDKDLSYEKYAAKILNTDIIFVHENGEDKYKGSVKFSEIMDHDSSDEMIFHALSIVFPDVRAKKYIEIRMPDEVPYPYNFACLALIKGIFYDEENLNKMYDTFSNMDYMKFTNLKSRAERYGLMAKYEDKDIYKWGLDFVAMAKKSLDNEAHFLDPLEEILKEGKSPRDIYENLYKEDPKKAIREFSADSSLRRM